MITTMIAGMLMFLITAIFYFLPVVTISSIPYIGSTVSSLLLTIVKMFNAFADTFPYVTVLWHTFLYVVLPFEFIMLIMKFFLGSRSIHHD